MAKETIVRLLDDLDGSTAEASVEFTWGGVEYVIDLSGKNAKAFEKAVAPYVAGARRVGTRAGVRRRPARKVTAGKGDQSAVRQWALANGYTVSERGRIPNAVRAAFEAQDGAAATAEAAEAPRKAARKTAARKAPARKATARKAAPRRRASASS